MSLVAGSLAASNWTCEMKGIVVNQRMSGDIALQSSCLFHT
jgi:hypothetical protein